MNGNDASLDFFWKLSNVKENVRTDAAVKLLHSLIKNKKVGHTLNHAIFGAVKNTFNISERSRVFTEWRSDHCAGCLHFRTTHTWSGIRS